MLGISRKSTGLVVSSILIFLSALASVWMYRVTKTLQGLEVPADEMERSVSCLRYGFGACADSDQVRRLIAYSFFR